MSEEPLAGKTALVTGAARRVGAAIARTLHGAGANVVIHYRNSASDAEALAAELGRARRRSVALVQADLLDVRQLPGVIEAAVAAFGRLDVLVNNASSFYATPIGSTTAAQFDDLIGSNLRAPLFLSQAAAPHLRAQCGLIVNIADIHGLKPLRHHTAYSAAKAGLIMLTRSLARELGPEVRVNAIAPGPVLWPEQDLSEADREEIIQRTVLKRAGSPQDVARTVLFFATEAPYITGQILPVDGGRSVGA
ncbi:MAG: pteridine reductase [Steroidobacteraceae bacterium]